jgi:hypothetical protein
VRKCLFFAGRRERGKEIDFAIKKNIHTNTKTNSKAIP